jgi:hypothetical protein
MAELLIVVVVVVLLLMYAADRARKLRVRARQLSGMNDRLDAAVAKVDEEQQQKRAVVRASAELTSVMPAIKRPPLTIPGMAGHGDAAEPAPASAERVAAPPAPRLADDTLSMPAADGMPVPKIPVTSDGTLIMRPVPDQGPVPAGEVLLAPDGIRDERAASQEQANRD